MTSPSIAPQSQPAVPTRIPRDPKTTFSPNEPPLGSASSAQAAPARRPATLAAGSRAVLAASGFVMLGYLVLHLGGNLLAFAGSAAFDAYARSLRELGSPLVGAGVLLTLGRAVLAGALVAHLAAHVRITLRPPVAPSMGVQPARAGGRSPSATPYDPVPPAYAAYPLPILLPTGGVIFLFVTLHLAQLTFGATVPAFDPADPYHNLITALRSWPVALAYLAAAAAVGAHLVPGIWTGMRSLRLISPRTEGLARVLAPAIALVTVLGLASVPAAVLLGGLN